MSTRTINKFNNFYEGLIKTGGFHFKFDNITSKTRQIPRLPHDIFL